MHSKHIGKSRWMCFNGVRRANIGIMKILASILLLTLIVCPVEALVYSGRGGWGAGLNLRMGTWPRTLDTYDFNDSLSTVSNSGWTGGAYHLFGTDGWDGTTGFYSTDVRPDMHLGESKMWTIYIWAMPSVASNDLLLTWMIASAYSDPLVLAQLECIQKPADILGGPSVGTIWTAPPTMTLPFYTTTDGLTGYGFKFTLTMVPEPSSLLALCAGLMSAGVMVRRRRN